MIHAGSMRNCAMLESEPREDGDGGVARAHGSRAPERARARLRGVGRPAGDARVRLPRHSRLAPADLSLGRGRSRRTRARHRAGPARLRPFPVRPVPAPGRLAARRRGARRAPRSRALRRVRRLGRRAARRRLRPRARRPAAGCGDRLRRRATRSARADRRHDGPEQAHLRAGTAVAAAGAADDGAVAVRAAPLPRPRARLAAPQPARVGPPGAVAARSGGRADR